MLRPGEIRIYPEPLSVLPAPEEIIKLERDFELRCWTADEMEKLEAEITKLEQEAIQARQRVSVLSVIDWLQDRDRIMSSMPRVMVTRLFGVTLKKKSNGKKKAKTHRKAKQARKGTPKRRQSSRSRRKGRV